MNERDRVAPSSACAVQKAPRGFCETKNIENQRGESPKKEKKDLYILTIRDDALSILKFLFHSGSIFNGFSCVIITRGDDVFLV
jgi:hypothetical protein